MNVDGSDDVDSKSLATGSSLTRIVGGNRAFSIGRRFTETTEALVAGMQARIASRVTERARELRARQRRRERRQEQKAAKTLSAILLTFIITWTPYNVFVVITAFCNDCISEQWFAFGKSIQYSVNDVH
jgi:7 transmembrane receptor (rhodopsin family)